MFFTTAECLTTSNDKENLCGIEITMIRNGRLYTKKRWLFCPPSLQIEDTTLTTYGITLTDLMDAPSFYELWDEIRPYFEGQLIIFHQLPKNVQALSKALYQAGLTAPHFTFGSTMMLAKRLYPHLPNAKCETLMAYLSITEERSKPFYPTLQMAQIFLAMGKQFNLTDEEVLFTKAGICLGSFQEDGICYPDFLSPYTPPVLEAITQKNDMLQTASLRNEVISFTGPLSSMTRSMAVKKITTLGGHYQSQVTSKTTLLVTNLYDLDTQTATRLTTKLNKALILKGQGQNLTIINETQFTERLKASY